MAQRKSKMVSMRMTETQFEYLQKIVQQVRMESGFRITRASIMMKLMEYGLERFKQEHLEGSLPVDPQHYEKTGT